MKRIFVYLLSLVLSLASPAFAESSLTFGAATTDSVNHGSNASLDNLATWTVVMWVYPTTLTAGRVYFNKLEAAPDNGRRRCLVDTATDEVSCQVRENDLLANYITNNANLTVNKWWFIAATFDLNAAAGESFNIYVGDFDTIATECTYGTATDRTGTLDSDAAGSMIIGNTAGGAASFQGDFSVFAHWNRVLTTAEIQNQQFSQVPTSGAVLLTYEGFNGTGSQRDLSGNANNGSVSGPTASSNAPPIFLNGGAL